MTPLGLRQRLLLHRLRSGDWLPVQGRELQAAASLHRRGLIEYQQAHGVARVAAPGPRQWPAAELMREAQNAPDRPAPHGTRAADGE